MPFFTEHDAGRDWRQISQADDSFLSPEYFYDLLLEPGSAPGTGPPEEILQFDRAPALVQSGSNNDQVLDVQLQSTHATSGAFDEGAAWAVDISQYQTAQQHALPLANDANDETNQQAYDRGFQDGRKKGREEAEITYMSPQVASPLASLDDSEPSRPSYSVPVVDLTEPKTTKISRGGSRSDRFAPLVYYWDVVRSVNYPGDRLNKFLFDNYTDLIVGDDTLAADKKKALALKKVVDFWCNKRRDKKCLLEHQGTEADDLSALAKGVQDGIPALTRGRKTIPTANLEKVGF